MGRPMIIALFMGLITALIIRRNTVAAPLDATPIACTSSLAFI